MGWVLRVNRNVHYTMVRSLDFIPSAMGRSEGTWSVLCFKDTVWIFVRHLIRKKTLKNIKNS